MKRLLFGLVTAIALVAQCQAEEPMLLKAKVQLLVEQAGEMLAEANTRGSATHNATCKYFFGLIYGSGTNILARKESAATAQLMRKYMDLIDKNYQAYTKVETATSVAAATGNSRGKSGGRHRAKRLANTARMSEKELDKAIKQWEAFATQLKRGR